MIAELSNTPAPVSELGFFTMSICCSLEFCALSQNFIDIGNGVISFVRTT